MGLGEDIRGTGGKGREERVMGEKGLESVSRRKGEGKYDGCERTGGWEICRRQGVVLPSEKVRRRSDNNHYSFMHESAC